MQPIDYNDPNQATEFELFIETIDKVAEIAYNENNLKGFYDDEPLQMLLKYGVPVDIIHQLTLTYFGNKLMLMVTELAEAHEVIRKNILKSEHIPEFTALEEEVADLFIRGLDFAGYNKLRLGEAIKAKLIFNQSRPYKHGKKF